MPHARLPPPSPSPRPGRRPTWWDHAESIDYAPINNDVILKKDHSHNRHIYGFSGRTFATVIATVIVGALIGVTARLMAIGIDTATNLRNAALARLIVSSGMPYAFAIFAVGSTLLVATVAAVVQLGSPGAAGSGVSLVMAFLNGNNLHGLLTPAVYVVKLCGTIATRAAGLALGPEAPLVHLGCVVASLVFGIERRWTDPSGSQTPADLLDAPSDGSLGKKDPLLRLFSNSSHRQIVSAGAAAGLAAAFGAPIGGVLFALEEASSVWSRKTAWRCLLCASTAVFTLSQLDPALQGGLLALQGVYPLSSRQWLKQLPFVTVVSAGAGLLGAAFNWLRGGIQGLRASGQRHALRTLEAAAVAAATVAFIASSSSVAGRCLEVPPSWDPHQVVQLTCNDGQYNDLATAFLGSGPWVIRSLLGLGSKTEPIDTYYAASKEDGEQTCSLQNPCYFSAQALVVVCLGYLALMAVSSGLAVPGGLFMPCIMVGASFGALGGVLLDAALPDSWDIQAGVYALVGAAAALCALFRSNVSLVVILVEGTSGISFLPGILAAIIISNFIAQYVHPDGVYEGELERDGRVVFLRQEPPAALRWRTAERIAACPVIGFCRIEDVSRVLRVLKSSTHNGFPVHNPIDPGEDPVPKLEGFVLRSQLLVLLQEQAFCDANGAYLDAPPDVVAYEARLQALMDVAKLCSDGLGGALEHRLDPLAGQGGLESTVGASPAMLQTLETLQSLQTVPNLAPFLGTPTPDGASPSGSSAPMLSPALYLNLTPFLDRGVITVRPDTPAVTIHRLFVGLSLRHLCVTDAQSRVTGIITRRDLDHAGGKGWWRSSKMAPQPAHLGRVLRGSSGSWLSASLHALMASQRGVSDLFQRLNLSPKSPRGLTSDGAQHSAWSYARDTEQGSLPAADTEDQRSPLLWSPFGN